MKRHFFDVGFGWTCSFAVASFALLGACSSGRDSGDPLAKPPGSSDTPSTAVVQVSSGGPNSGSGDATGGTETGSDGSDCGKVALNGCFGTVYEAEGAPLDIYILFDDSGSMQSDVGGMTRLDAVRLASEQFLRDPASAGIGVGIGYFGVQPVGQVSCDASSYSTPAVPITQDHEQVLTSLSEQVPTGETPTGAALRGACAYAESYRLANPTHSVVTLLVTDGNPEAPASCRAGGCCPTLDDATSAVQDCLGGKPSIATYVLGVGPDLDNLNQIASAGGTHLAYLVGDQDVAGSVLAALNKIRYQAQIPCNLDIPPGQDGRALDYDQVNVLYAPTPCAFEPIYHVEASSDCSSDGGWYYDDPAAPTSVNLCPTTCDQVRTTATSLEFSIGCAAVAPPVR